MPTRIYVQAMARKWPIVNVPCMQALKDTSCTSHEIAKTETKALAPSSGQDEVLQYIK